MRLFLCVLPPVSLKSITWFIPIQLWGKRVLLLFNKRTASLFIQIVQEEKSLHLFIDILKHALFPLPSSCVSKKQMYIILF